MTIAGKPIGYSIFGLVVAFYATMVTMLAFLIFSFGTARLLGPKFQRTLLFMSALILTGLGVYQLVKGIQYFTETS